MITCHVRYGIDPARMEDLARFARFGADQEFVGPTGFRDDSGCVRRYERTFLRPLLP